MSKVIIASFGIIFGLLGIAALIGVVLGHVNQLIICVMGVVIACVSCKEFRRK